MKKTTVAVSWSPDDIPDTYKKTELLMDILTEYCRDLIWISCKSAEELCTEQIFRKADLLIVWLKQDSSHMERHVAGFSTIHKPVMFVIYDYFESCSVNKRELIRKYRIKEECLCAIPYNIRMDWFAQRGMLRLYLNSRNSQGPYEEYSGFFRELDDTRRKLLQMLMHLCAGERKKCS